VRSTAAPYTESRLTRSVANERVGFPVVEQIIKLCQRLLSLFLKENANVGFSRRSTFFLFCGKLPFNGITFPQL
jgi:hypothetical protein